MTKFVTKIKITFALCSALSCVGAVSASLSDEATQEDIARIEAMKLNPVTEAAAKTFAGALRYSQKQTGKTHPDLLEPMPTGVDDRDYKEYRLELMRLKREQKQKEIENWERNNRAVGLRGSNVNIPVSQSTALVHVAGTFENEASKQGQLYQELEKAAEEDYQNRIEDMATDLSGEEYIPMDQVFGEGHYRKNYAPITEDKTNKAKAKAQAKKRKAEKEQIKAQAAERARQKRELKAQQKHKRDMERMRLKMKREEAKEKDRYERRRLKEERMSRKLLEENGIDPEKEEKNTDKAKDTGDATDKTLKVKEVFRQTKTEEIKNELWNPADLYHQVIEEEKKEGVPTGESEKAKPISLRLLGIVQTAFAAEAEDPLAVIRDQAWKMGKKVGEESKSPKTEKEKLEEIGIAIPDLEKYSFDYPKPVTVEEPEEEFSPVQETVSSEKDKKKDRDDNLYLTTFFISESMGKDKVQELMEAYAGDNTVRFVLKGFNGVGTINDGLKWIIELVRDMKHPPILTIDPELFRRYDVKLAPTMLIEVVEPIEEAKDQPIPNEILKVLSTLAKALGMDTEKVIKDAKQAALTKPIRKPALIVSGVTSRSWGVSKAKEDKEFNQGVQGKVFDVVERDIEEIAKERIAKIDWEAKKKVALERFWSNQEKNYIALDRAAKENERIVDPSIVLNRDVFDNEGKVLFKKGQIFNPFDAMPFTRTMIVFNASLKREIEEVAHLIEKERKEGRQVILIASEFAEGKALEQIQGMNDDWKENIYVLTPEIKERFEIRATPTVVRADNEKKVFRVKEINLVTP